MKTNPFARLFAVLGVALLVGVLLFSRDNRLVNQGQAPVAPTAGSEALSPTIASLADAPAPAPASTPVGAAPAQR